MNTQPTLTLTGEGLTLDVLQPIVDCTVVIAVSPEARRRLRESAARVDAIATGERAAYGINTGFGNLCRKRINAADVRQLQRNLILSHAVGVGPDMPPHLVRMMMALKINALVRGFSGVSESTVDSLVDLLNHGVVPVVPMQGSLGASGDLAPLAHMVLPMLGLGEVWYRGKKCPAEKALSDAGLSPVELGAKDGLALINGTQFMLSHAVDIVCRVRPLLKLADAIGACSLDGAAGSVAPFEARLHALRPHPGAALVAGNFRRLMDGSEILKSHVDCDRVQDPYSLRCIPQVHGASRDATEHAASVIERELNAVTDNPVIFEDGRVVSGGLFHGQPLALIMDYLAMAIAEIASISERRTYLLLGGIGGLPELLMGNTGINSGFMIPQYTAAALVSENKGLCMPACVDTIPTSLGQEDHVSMGARAAVKCRDVLANTEQVLAIEQLCAAQALDLRTPLGPGAGPAALRDQLRKRIPFAERDREYGRDMVTCVEMLRSGALLDAVESSVGPLD